MKTSHVLVGLQSFQFLDFWRCYRSVCIAFSSTFTANTCNSPGSGLLFIILPFDKGWILVIFITITAFVNVVIAILIVVRLFLHQRYIRGVLGPAYASGYTRVMAMCVESSSLIVAFNIAYLALDFEEFLGTVILINLLVHIYVSFYFRRSLQRLISSAGNLAFLNHLPSCSRTSHVIRHAPRHHRCQHRGFRTVFIDIIHESHEIRRRD